MMVGREVTLRVDRAAAATGAEICAVSNLRLLNARGGDVCKDLSLTVKAGEILGLVGVEGNGQAEVMEAIAGLRHVHDGRIAVSGQDIVPMTVLQRRDIGIASIPEDRIAEGLATGATVAENIVATRLKDDRYVRRGILDLRAIKANAAKLIEQFSIRVNGPGVPVGTLSGGNMQKVVVARELSEQPKLLLVSQPTRGVDLGATQFIWKTIAAARDAGAAVLLSSADLSELLALSDRLLVFYRGRIVAAFRNRDDLSPETLGTYMLGLSEQSPEEMRAGQ
jgi:simple sugar transport system ATP-binding protein